MKNSNTITFNDLPNEIQMLKEEFKSLKLILTEFIKDSKVKEATKKEFWTVEDIIKLTGKSKFTVYSWTQHKKIPCFKFGNKLYFEPDTVLKWMKAEKRYTDKEITEEADELIVQSNRSKIA